MKILNKLFAAVYVLALVASVWFGVSWMVTRGISSMFDDVTELVFAVIYIIALILSIFMHWKLKDKNTSVAQTTCVMVTSLNVLSLIALAVLTFTSGSEAGLFSAFWMFGVLVLWFVGLVSGSMALKNNRSTNV